jgi:predicted nucleotidyltransferase
MLDAMATVQEIDAAEAARLNGLRDALVASLASAAAGRRWHYLLFGSLARGEARRGSDADIAVVDAGPDWLTAERAAKEACGRLGVRPDVLWWEDLRPEIREVASRDGIRCP